MHDIALKPHASLTPSNPWAALPPLGDLQAYIRGVQALPMLSAEEERAAAEKLRNDNDLQAASQLVLSHLRVVVAIARQYAGYGLPQADLIQEGNVGLMKAVRRFDPSHGTRLVTYAMHWIKAEIHEFIVRNWRMVKVATTKAQRKLFFNLRSLRHSLRQDADDDIQTSATLRASEVEEIARTLNVKPDEVRAMQARLAGADVSLDPTPGAAEDESMAPVAHLHDPAQDPAQVLESLQAYRLATEGVREAVQQLDERARAIVLARWLPPDGEATKTLHELAAEWGISAERVRQLESAALRKLKTALQTQHA
ncbi:MAG: RNA polymerase sigma factor RpoH [Proteobacteria bacterium]|nr:RNA polymerase sigma factor RpoH [Pseudomonadota bacterium]MDA0869194.1 RNA polymerase sigma factor RpoH [Pseudomonadota bacterium]MDA1328703.1 RNA polymerase sigma factor RpoH [Pseudomonadota bacterium]